MALAGLLARPDATVVEQALLLALDLDDPKAATVLRGIVRDRETPIDMRQRALSALVERRVPGIVPDLHGTRRRLDVARPGLAGAGGL